MAEFMAWEEDRRLQREHSTREDGTYDFNSIRCDVNDVTERLFARKEVVCLFCHYMFEKFVTLYKMVCVLEKTIQERKKGTNEAFGIILQFCHFCFLQ